jgi:hypothetical protein
MKSDFSGHFFQRAFDPSVAKHEHVASCEFFPMNLGEFPICVRCGIAELTAAWDSKNLRGVQQLAGAAAIFT